MTRVDRVPVSWKWYPRDREPPRWYVRGEAELLFFDPHGHGRARDAKGAREATETAAFLIGMQDLLAARLWIGVGSGILTALPSASTAAIELFAIGGMTIAHQSIALTVRAVNGDGDHERLLFFENGLTFTVYHILLICATTVFAYTLCEPLGVVACITPLEGIVNFIQ